MLHRYRALAGSFAGHYWTLRPFASDRYDAKRFGAARTPAHGNTPWTAQARDTRFGALRLTGRLLAPDGATAVLLCVHGLGGSADSPYLARAAAAAAARGWASLRLSMRGADGSGDGFYHAGLTDDLHVALASPELASSVIRSEATWRYGSPASRTIAACGPWPRCARRSISSARGPPSTARVAGFTDVMSWVA